MAEKLGATHSVASAGEAQDLVMQLTRGVGADKSIVTVDVVNEEVVQAGFDVLRKGGTEVITGLADPTKQTIHLSGAVMTLFQKTVKGTLFGNSNPMRDITKILDLYRAGSVKLDELVTKRYTLDQINEGYDDLLAGKNIRGIIVHEH
jgi:S-(hydroxymethyl)glutathione dehydrogenase/alcohol dehydrogenase